MGGRFPAYQRYENELYQTYVILPNDENLQMKFHHLY